MEDRFKMWLKIQMNDENFKNHFDTRKDFDKAYCRRLFSEFCEYDLSAVSDFVYDIAWGYRNRNDHKIPGYTLPEPPK